MPSFWLGHRNYNSQNNILSRLLEKEHYGIFIWATQPLATPKSQLNKQKHTKPDTVLKCGAPSALRMRT